MNEPTDEMVHAFIRAYSEADDGSARVILEETAERAGLAAVLAIVERDQVPTQDAYDAACRALEKHRQRADRAEAELADFRDKLAALAAIEDYIAESGKNAARNIRDLLAGRGEHDNDPRVQARAWGLEWTVAAPSPSAVRDA